MKDHVIKVLTLEHGAEVIKYFRSLGIKTTLEGKNCESNGDSYIYYGVIDGRFDCYALQYVRGKNIPIKPNTKAINPTNKYIAFFNLLILLSS